MWAVIEWAGEKAPVRPSPCTQLVTAGEGVASDGVTSEGVTSEGVTSEGVTSEGVTSDGVTSDGVTVYLVVMGPNQPLSLCLGCCVTSWCAAQHAVRSEYDTHKCSEQLDNMQ